MIWGDRWILGRIGVWLILFGLAHTSHAENVLVTDFKEPLSLTYQDVGKGTSRKGNETVIQSRSGKGGAGMALEADWSAYANYSPAVRLKLGADNRASEIRLQFTDAGGGKAIFSFSLEDASTDEYRWLLPKNSRALKSPQFALSQVRELHVQGNWRADPVHVHLDGVQLQEPTQAILAERDAARERLSMVLEGRTEKMEREMRLRRRILEGGAEHESDGPRVVHVGAAGEALIGLEIQAGNVPRVAPVPYEKKPGDVRRTNSRKVLAWKNKKPALVGKNTELRRKVGDTGRTKKVGALNLGAGTLWTETRTGEDLNLQVVDDPMAYRISIDGQEPVFPEKVYRKSKANDLADVGEETAARHFIYLQLAMDLEYGATYQIDLHGINTQQATVTYRHDPREARSEAIHVSHLGYRQDDPFKRAYLSLWTGTGGGQTFSAKEFHLINELGETLYRGPVKEGISEETEEPFVSPGNHTKATVYHLDFSSFDVLGTYVVHVPGLGISYPFEIGPSSWEDAFRTSMHGFLSHRSGIQLGSPFTSYRRPRNMHPEDGQVVYQTDVTIWEGEAKPIEESLLRLMGPELDPSKLEEVPDAWGGYMDGGDWNRRSQHLVCTLRHLELLEMFPERIGQMNLSLPPEEAENGLPDILDEALWNLDLYRRLQKEDGGVGGGIASTAQPREGEASWQASLLIGAYRPDPESSYRYAGVAAKAARLLGEDEKAGLFEDSAIRAWEWAQENADRELAAAKSRDFPRAQLLERKVLDMKVLAAAELYRLTEDSVYLEELVAALKLKGKRLFTNADVAMSFALIPVEQTNVAVREQAIAYIRELAEAALAFSEQNGFNLALPNHMAPMSSNSAIWSVPGTSAPPVLPRAHYLTGETRFLAGAIAACQYPGGANPMNMCYTTGIGPRHPQSPFQVDHRISGQTPPAGITVSGQGNPASGYGFNKFAHEDFLNRYGGVDSRKWPAAEAYFDLPNWPAMNGYAMERTMSPTSYVWGYLAGRK